MPYINILIGNNEKYNLQSFVEYFFKNIGISGYIERESSNYKGGNYYKYNDKNINFTISLSDDEENADLPLWVHISSEKHSYEYLEKMINNIVITKILPAGFCAALMVNYGKIDEKRVDYHTIFPS